MREVGWWKVGGPPNCQAPASSMGPVPPGVLTVVMGEHQQPQPHQHLSQLVIAATVLPGSMRHKDEGPAGVRGSWVRRAARLEQYGAFRTPAMSGDQVSGEPALSLPGHAVVVATAVASGTRQGTKGDRSGPWSSGPR